MVVSLNDVLADVARAAGLDPEDWTVQDVKISGYVNSKFFGSDEAVAETRRMAQTLTFDPPR